MAIDNTAIIHPTAIVEDGAQIGPGCSIGPYCLVGPQVVLGAHVSLEGHVAVAGITKIGDATKIWPFASIGHAPQDLKYAGEPTELVIGARNRIREHSTMNPGTIGGGGVTRVGDDGLFMMGSHVAHDCTVGNHVILANNASLAGHCVVEDRVIMGGLSAVHQFVRLGRGAMIGGLAAVVADVIPYGSVAGDRAHLVGLNLVGLKRSGIDRVILSGLRAAFSEMFEGESTFSERVAVVETRYPDNPLVIEVSRFVQSGSSRSFTMPPG